MTTAERQKRFKAKHTAAGLVQVNVWVPAAAAADMQRAAEIMRAHPHLTVARLVDSRTGKLVDLKKNKESGFTPRTEAAINRAMREGGSLRIDTATGDLIGEDDA